MKTVLSAFVISMILAPAFAAAPNMTPATGRGRASMANQMMAAPRAVMSQNQIQAMAAQPETVAGCDG